MKAANALKDACVSGLTEAVSHGRRELVEAISNMVVNVGHGPLVAACRERHIDIVRYLLSRDAKVNPISTILIGVHLARHVIVDTQRNGGPPLS
jgi:hypothetical protein